jgi:arginyl-tRNA synthetase
MGLARRLGMGSREVAAAIAERVQTGDLFETPQVDGPGFLNLVLQRDWLERHTEALAADDRAGVPVTDSPRRVVVDYSGPNAAKELHVGHLRSTVIGDAVTRLLGFQGHEVIRRDHLGDWGTPVGMLLENLVDQGWAGGAVAGRAVGDLTARYREARARFEADPEFAARARRRVVALQKGEPETLTLWRELVAESEGRLDRARS